MTVSPKIRRLSDKLLDAVDIADKHGHTDISAALRIVQQALLVQELARQDLRRDSDEPDFVASRSNFRPVPAVGIDLPSSKT